MVNYTAISNTVATAIKGVGQYIKVQLISGTLISTYGVWGKIENKDVDGGAIGMVTQSVREIYLPSMKTSPEVGGFVIVNKVSYAISRVEAYQPLNAALAYKLEVIV